MITRGELNTKTTRLDRSLTLRETSKVTTLLAVRQNSEVGEHLDDGFMAEMKSSYAGTAYTEALAALPLQP